MKNKLLREPEASNLAIGNETILLVDDEPGILDTGKQCLKRHGYGVIVAVSGEEAIRKYQNHTVDLVILDVGLPGINGIECLAKIRAINPKAKILMSTGYSSEQDEIKIKALGVDAYLRKPFSLSELIELTQNILSESSS